MDEHVNQEVNQEEVVEPQASPEEQRAMELGWKPKDKWEGAPEDWVSAKWWLKYGDLEQQKISLESESKKKERVIGAMKEHYIHVKADAKAELIAQIKRDKQQAVKEENYERVAELDEQIDRINAGLDARFNQRDTELKEVEAEAVPPDPRFVEWNKHNSWYKLNSKEPMTEYADTIAIGYKARNPNATYEDIFKFVEDSVKSRFPEKFKTMPNSPVNDGGNNNAPRKPKNSGIKLDEAQKEAARAFGLTEEEYAKSLEEYDRKKGRA